MIYYRIERVVCYERADDAQIHRMIYYRIESRHQQAYQQLAVCWMIYYRIESLSELHNSPIDLSDDLL